MMKRYRTLAAFTFAILLTLLVVILNSVQSDNSLRVEWSAEGEWILFSCGIFTLDNAKSHLYIMRPDGSYLQKITTDDLVTTSPSWSPDGKWITFISENSLFKIRPNGTEAQEIAVSSQLEEILSLDWAANHDWIAYTTLGLQGSSRIHRIDSNGDNHEILVEGLGAFDRLKWSSDDEMLAYAILPGADSSGIYTIRMDSNEPNKVFEYQQIIGYLDWSPDNSEFLITLFKGQQSRLYRLNLADKEEIPVELDFDIESASWSYNGEWIIFSGYRADNPGGYQIFKAQPDGSDLERLTGFTDCNASSPQWYEFSS